MSRRHIDTTDCAKLIRKALKAAFPRTKFSVRSSRYAGGSSINVAWTDGPAESDVDPLVQRYSGADFDGMQDLKTYRTDLVSNEDGSVEEVHYGADFVFCRREFSDAFKARADEQCAESYGREWWAQYSDHQYPGKATVLRVWCCGSNENGTSATESETCGDRRIYADALAARWRWRRTQGVAPVDSVVAKPESPWAAFIAREGGGR